MNLLIHAISYNYRTIFRASCYFIPLGSKYYLNTPPSHSHHGLSCRSCTFYNVPIFTVSRFWPPVTPRLEEHICWLAMAGYRVHERLCSLHGEPSFWHHSRPDRSWAGFQFTASLHLHYHRVIRRQ
jgi:hypothetical protein